MTCSPVSTTRVASPVTKEVLAGAVAARSLDAESLSWWRRLHGVRSVRRRAIAELHARLRDEARFQIQRRASCSPEFPRGDLDDLAVQAADDALMVLLRKLDDYRGDSQFWTWARRFAQLEASVSMRRHLLHERRILGDPQQALMTLAAPASSVHEHAERREVLRGASHVIANRLTTRQRTVVLAVAINGVSTRALARDLNTTPGAIYKALHDARLKLRAELAL